MKAKSIKAEITGAGETVRYLPNEYRECADEDGVIRKYKVPVHEPSFKAGYEEGVNDSYSLDKMEYQSGHKAGIREVVEWVKEIAILGYKEGELGIKPPTDWVLDLYLWQAQLKEWGIHE